jgi:hypothetical protein
MVQVASSYGIHNVSIKFVGRPRDCVQIESADGQGLLPFSSISTLERENRVLRLLIYDLVMGYSKLQDLGDV